MNSKPPASRLEERLRARQFVITAEIAPPVSCDPHDLLAKALPLRGLADAVNVTDGAGARAAYGRRSPRRPSSSRTGSSRSSSSPAATATGSRCRAS